LEGAEIADFSLVRKADDPWGLMDNNTPTKLLGIYGSMSCEEQLQTSNDKGAQTNTSPLNMLFGASSIVAQAWASTTPIISILQALNSDDAEARNYARINIAERTNDNDKEIVSCGTSLAAP